MGKFIDLTGQRFNNLVILSRTTKPGQPIKWKCQCDCGNIFEARGNDIKNGKIKSCGCLRKKQARNLNFKDITNQRFGRLVALKNTHNGYWQCQCDCGNICEVKGSALRSGNTQSCGCLHKETFIHSTNLIGQRFGKLVVLEQTDKRINNNIVWKCKCDCGGYKEVYTSLLTQNKVKSCGCLISYGEEKIKNILIKNNIPFEMQKTFDTCIFPNTKAKAKFDFYVNQSYLIEFDGKQHYGIGGWGEDFTQIKARDEYKNQWCKKNNIPLIRIPYTEIDNIDLEMITLKRRE